ncbi:YbaB/EbfC family nucleoid-associated protein [Beijerinckia mobilis]|uniref:YbaB/EbfC family nucleoid-associated protein n=1 Tax=Beijerinckia mobilis TaxID=231434 RepID=UPI00055915F3|nr:YbaB/EbfC family nucleoid-associated protein [Beijerinckia mobilis]
MKDMMGLLKQAQAMQAKVQDMQAQLEEMTVEGQAGAGLVRITLTVKGQIRNVSIDASLLKPEEKEIVEDLVALAYENARHQAEKIMEEKMREVTGGLQLPF